MRLLVNTLAFGLLTFCISCSTDEKPIDILLNAPHGAVLSNTEIGNNNFMYSDLQSTFSVEVRANDQEKGEFFDFVRVYVSLKSNTTGGVNSREEVVLEDILPSAFYRGEFDRPRTMLTYSFQEVLDALGLQQEDVAPGDQFFIRPDMHLKDGRIIGFENRSPGIIAEFCEHSPFLYQINVVGPISNSLYTGTYSFELVSSTSEIGAPESGVTTITAGDFVNQRRSSFLNFTVGGNFILPDIYQAKGGLCRTAQLIVFWGPQENSFGSRSDQDDSVFFADFVIGYDGWVGGDFSTDPILVTYRFTKQ